MANTLLIRTPTLKGIVDAIAQSDVDLPTIAYDESAELHFIDRELLERIADIVREKSGVTGTIPVTELSARILALESTSYMGTTWTFRDDIDYDEYIEYITNNGEEGDYGGAYLHFDINFTVPEGVEFYDYEEEIGYTVYKFKAMQFYANDGDEGDCIYYVPSDDTLAELVYRGHYVGDGGMFEQGATIVLDEEPSAELLDFLETFAEQRPVYEGVIPLGKYTLNSVGASESLGIMFAGVDGEGGDIPLDDWFIAYDGDTPRSCFGLDGGDGWFEAYYGDAFDCFGISDDTTVEVTREVEVSEDDFNLFMSYFTPQ